MEVGEEASFTLNLTSELDGDTVASHTFKIYDSANAEVTTNFGGGSSESAGVISFGVKAYAVGTYTIKIWVTLTEVLPDASTAKEFLAKMTFSVI